jgi:hypothetical protein
VPTFDAIDGLYLVAGVDEGERSVRSLGGQFEPRLSITFFCCDLDVMVSFWKRSGTIIPGKIYGFVKTKPELEVPDIRIMS